MQEAFTWKKAADAKDKGFWADYSWQSPCFAAVALLKEARPGDKRFAWGRYWVKYWIAFGHVTLCPAGSICRPCKLPS
jgi:hypothetical protein